MKKYSTFNEQNLICLAQTNNDRFAIEELLCRYKNTVRSIARRFYITTGDIEDLIQEGMIAVYNAILSYNQEKIPFKKYLAICIERKMISMVRCTQGQKHKPLQNYLPLLDMDIAVQNLTSFETPEDRVLGEEGLLELLDKIKSQLSMFEYSAMQLYIQGLTMPEIAKKQNTTVKSIDNALQRAKIKIRRLMQDESLSTI